MTATPQYQNAFIAHLMAPALKLTGPEKWVGTSDRGVELSDRPRPKPETPDLLMSLPPELRVRIYDFSAVHSQVIHIDPDSATRRSRYPRADGLLLTSKTLRREILYQYSLRNTFTFHVRPYCKKEVQRAADWLRGKHATCGLASFSRFKLKFYGSPWSNLADFMPLLLLIRDIGFHPGTPAARQKVDAALQAGTVDAMRKVAKYSMFAVDGTAGAGIMLVMEELAALARRKESRGLTEQAFRAAVHDLVSKKMALAWVKRSVCAAENKASGIRRKSRKQLSLGKW